MRLCPAGVEEARLNNSEASLQKKIQRLHDNGTLVLMLALFVHLVPFGGLASVASALFVVLVSG